METINQPGTARYGNFINYYTFNNAIERVNLLPKNLFEIHNVRKSEKMYCLDIGCNAGVNIRGIIKLSLCTFIATGGLVHSFYYEL